MHQSQSSIRAMSFHKQIARRHRQSIFSKRRKQMLKKQTQFPLISQTLQNYWDLSSSKLLLYRDQIFDTLDETNGEQLSEEQSYQLCQDLMHLLQNDKQFLVPYSFRFRKDQSTSTATVVAFIYDCLDPQEGNYWLPFMNQESRSTIYLSIQCSDEEDPYRWINDTPYLDKMVNDWGTLEEAQGAISWLLGEIKIQLTYFVRSVFERLFDMNKQRSLKLTPTVFTIVIRLMMLSQSDQKMFSFLNMLLNQSLIKVYQLNSSYQFDDCFLILVDVLLQKSKEMGKVIFTQKIFQHLLQMLFNSYNEKFMDENNPKYLKLRLSQKHFQQLQEAYLSRVIDACLNHLRMHRLFNNKTSINQKLLQLFHPGNFAKIQQKYIKLIEFNSVLKQKPFNSINLVYTDNLNSMHENSNRGQEGQQITFQI